MRETPSPPLLTRDRAARLGTTKEHPIVITEEDEPTGPPTPFVIPVIVEDAPSPSVITIIDDDAPVTPVSQIASRDDSPIPPPAPRRPLRRRNAVTSLSPQEADIAPTSSPVRTLVRTASAFTPSPFLRRPRHSLFVLDEAEQSGSGHSSDDSEEEPNTQDREFIDDEEYSDEYE